VSLAERGQHLAGSGVRAGRHRASSAGASRIGCRMAGIPAGTGGALANMSPFRNLGGETSRHLLGICAGRAGCRYAADDLRLTPGARSRYCKSIVFWTVTLGEEGTSAVAGCETW